MLNQWQFLWYSLNQGRKLASQGREIWLRTSTEQGWVPTLSDTDWSRNLYPWCRANGGCYVQLSSDGGRTWDRSVKIPTEPYMGGYTPRGVAQLQDGTVLMVTADHPLNHTVYAVRSRDGGLNWSKPVVLGKVDEGHMSEPTAVELPSGKIVAMIRSSTHYLHQSESSDGGLTLDPDPPHAHLRISRTPSAPIRWPDADHLRSPPLAFRDSGLPEPGRRAELDYDKEFVIRGDFPNRNLGYPVTIEYQPGHLFTIYYGEEPDGTTSIQGSYWEVA